MIKVSNKVLNRILDMAASKLADRVAQVDVDAVRIQDIVVERVASEIMESRYDMADIRDRAVQVILDSVDTDEIRGDVVEYFVDNLDMSEVYDRIVDNVECGPMSVAELAATVLAERVAQSIDDDTIDE
jgi:hypothetical protein